MKLISKIKHFLHNLIHKSQKIPKTILKISKINKKNQNLLKINTINYSHKVKKSIKNHSNQ